MSKPAEKTSSILGRGDALAASERVSRSLHAAANEVASTNGPSDLGAVLGPVAEEVESVMLEVRTWRALGALTEALRWYAGGGHVGYRDSADVRVDGDEYVRDHGERARGALEEVWGD